ncbi:MAG: glycosyltransferase family 39 protein [Anaerolineales bacterium]
MTENRRKIWTIVLIVGILFQTGFLLREYVLPWGWRVKQVWDNPRLARSADLSLGPQAKRIIEYVNQVVPEDGTILLPPGQDESRFSVSRSMQYFFFPREVIACPEVGKTACREALSSPYIYILATSDFPPPSTAQRDFSAPETDLGWFKGVYGPSFQQPEPAPRFAWIPWLGVLGTDLAVLLGLGLMGGATLLAIRHGWQPLELLALAVPVGAGILTFCLFLLSWLGVRLSFGLCAGLAIVISVLAGALARHQKGRMWQITQWRRGWDGAGGVWRVVLLVAGLGLLGLAVALSVGASYRLYDPVQIWSVKGYGIGEAQSIFAGAEWGVHGLAYPLNIPLQVALFFMADGDALPGSKFLYPIYGVALCVSVFAFLRRQQIDERMAGLGAIFLGSVPIVFFHATSGFANLPFTALLVAGALWGLQGTRTSSIRDGLLSGLLLGLAAWTRPEGIFYALAALLLVSAASLRSQRTLGLMGALAAPLILISGTWFIFAATGSTVTGSTPERQILSYLGQTLSGRIDLSGLWTIISVFSYSMFVPYRAMFPAISATYWGVLFVVAIGMLIVSGSSFSLRQNSVWVWLLSLTGGFAALTVLEFYVQSYTIDNFPALIERAFPRAALPAAALLLVAAICALNANQTNSSSGSAELGSED